jgi:hypothetical protein
MITNVLLMIRGHGVVEEEKSAEATCRKQFSKQLYDVDADNSRCSAKMNDKMEGESCDLIHAKGVTYGLYCLGRCGDVFCNDTVMQDTSRNRRWERKRQNTHTKPSHSYRKAKNKRLQSQIFANTLHAACVYITHWTRVVTKPSNLDCQC